MRNKTVAASLMMLGVTTSSPAFSLGIWSDSYFELSAKGIIQQGDAIDIAADNPKPTNARNISVKTDCYMHIGNYDPGKQAYAFEIVCKGKDGWELTQYESASLDDLYPPISAEIGSTELGLYMTSTEGSVWDGIDWRLDGSDIVVVEYIGPVILDPKVDRAGATIKTAKFTTVKNGAITFEDGTGTAQWKGGFKSGMTAKWVEPGKVDSEALACLVSFANNDYGINPPCDPINNLPPP